MPLFAERLPANLVNLWRGAKGEIDRQGEKVSERFLNGIKHPRQLRREK